MASGVFGEDKTLVLCTAAVLTLLAPVFLRLPRKAGITAAVLVVALLQMAFDMPCAAPATLWCSATNVADARCQRLQARPGTSGVIGRALPRGRPRA